MEKHCENCHWWEYDSGRIGVCNKLSFNSGPLSCVGCAPRIITPGMFYCSEYKETIHPFIISGHALEHAESGEYFNVRAIDSNRESFANWLNGVIERHIDVGKS